MTFWLLFRMGIPGASQNMDPLNEDVEKMMSMSRMPMLAELFPYEEADPKARGGGRGKKKQVCTTPCVLLPPLLLLLT
eukprot:COSAG05_NODE_48_length_24425_cov_90.438543_8_plen_78_part_00